MHDDLDQNVADAEIQSWLTLLLGVVDITAHGAHTVLQSFLFGGPLVTKYRDFCEKLVCDVYTHLTVFRNLLVDTSTSTVRS